MSDASPDGDNIRDVGRLLALQATGLLDSRPEESFDRFTRLASRVLHAPVSLVSLVDAERQFFKSSVGLPEPWATARQTPLSHSFCRHVVNHREPLVIEDARRHPRLAGNPAITDLGVIAYLGVPLVAAGDQVLGSFCAIDGQPRRWSEADVGFMSDLAAAVITEIELRRLSSEALRGFRELRRLEDQRDDMVHALVHDLRNPLASLLAGLDMLEVLPGLTERHQTYIDRCRNGGRALLEMVGEILTVSRSEAGVLELDLQPLTARPLIEGALEQLNQLAVSARVTPRIRVAAGLPEFAGDAAKLTRVLVNLIANALAHSPPGTALVVGADPGEPPGSVLFTIADHGPGIPAADLQRIFRKFDQGGDAAPGSSGLGLHYCKVVVERHGGRIWAESAPGQGATLRFSLPAGAGAL